MINRRTVFAGMLVTALPAHATDDQLNEMARKLAEKASKEKGVAWSATVAETFILLKQVT